MRACLCVCLQAHMLMRVVFGWACEHVNVSALMYACVKVYRFCVLTYVNEHVLAYEWICVYVRSVCECIFVFYARARISAHVCISTCSWVQVCARVRASMCTWIHVCGMFGCWHMLVCVGINVFWCMYNCVHACAPVSIYVCECVGCVHNALHTALHIRVCVYTCT